MSIDQIAGAQRDDSSNTPVLGESDRPRVSGVGAERALTMIEMEVLSERPESHRVTYMRQKVSSDTVVFTFGIRRTDFQTAPFGFPFLTLNGFDVVHVAQAAGTQYQGLDLEEFAAIAAPITAGRRAVMYGSSLGAYAAIYFAPAINAYAVGASPIFPAAPSVTRYRADKIPIKHRSISANPAPSPITVVLDPFNHDDAAYLRDHILPGRPNATVYELPHSGHESLRLLSETKVLKEVVLALIRQEPVDFRQYRKKFEAAWLYRYNLAMHLATLGERERCIGLARELILERVDARLFNFLIKHFARTGEMATASALHSEALAICPPGSVTELPIGLASA